MSYHPVPLYNVIEELSLNASYSRIIAELSNRVDCNTDTEAKISPNSDKVKNLRRLARDLEKLAKNAAGVGL